MMAMSNDSPIGLVLSGGGAKGAFQAGVWKAMHELGLADRVRVISGTSVGAINGAAFATLRDPEKICRFWRERIDEVATPILRHLSIDALRHGIENTLAGRAFPFHGLLDRDALESILSSLLPTIWPEDAPAVTATTLECRATVLGELDASAYRLRRFRIDEEPDHGRRIAKILASAAIGLKAQVVERPSVKTRLVDAPQKLLRHDLVGVAVVDRKRGGNGGQYGEFLHLVLLA
jgi:predicted acylesterase/phospholipase RssA